MPKEKYICLACNKEFLRYKTQQKSSLAFCSRRCKNIIQPVNKKNQVEGVCGYCGKKYEKSVSKMKRSSYCSKDCQYFSRRGTSLLKKINPDRFRWLTEGVE
jgi:endogenous inhibitor of DNA gyrase (YacG/DUF329 family)